MQLLSKQNTSKIDQIIYGTGLKRRPSVQECAELQHFVENKLILKPKIWMAISLTAIVGNPFFKAFHLSPLFGEKNTPNSVPQKIRFLSI